MKAALYTHYGPPNNLRIEEVSAPVPGPTEVLVRVHAVSVNDWDYQLLVGDPFVNRMINGIWKPKRTILGSDIAGTVEQVGSAVTRFVQGDEVYGDLSNQWGGFAEFVCADQQMLARKSPRMSFVEAAAVPQAGMLAVQGLIDVGGIQAGQSILINGAGGGVGTFGVQIAKQVGVEITGVDSGEKLEMMRAQGFDRVIDYRKDDFTKQNIEYDLILDVKTNRFPLDYLRSLKRGGMYATVGGDTGRLMQTLLLQSVAPLLWKKQLRLVMLKPNKDLEYINGLYDADAIRPVIDGPYALEELPRLMEYFGRGEHKGKIVIQIL